MKVVINSDYGGFGVSILAMKHILQRKGITGIVFKDALNNQVIKKDISMENILTQIFLGMMQTL